MVLAVGFDLMAGYWSGRPEVHHPHGLALACRFFRRHWCSDHVLCAHVVAIAEEPALTDRRLILQRSFENSHAVLVLNAADGGARALWGGSNISMMIR
jgi:hypothetical protein